MIQLEKVCLVENCYTQCTFWNLSEEGIQCTHPFFDNGPYGSSFIAFDRTKKGIPKSCPLKRVSVTVITKLK
jgi:hypothetical protein